MTRKIDVSFWPMKNSISQKNYFCQPVQVGPSYVKPLQQCGQRQIANHTDYSCPLTELKGGLFCLCLYLSICLSVCLSLSICLSLSSRGGRWCDPRVGVHGDSVYQSINQSYNFNAPISINKNPESGAPVRYATFFNVRHCVKQMSL